MDHAISELCYKGILYKIDVIIGKNDHLMALDISWPFPDNALGNFKNIIPL